MDIDHLILNSLLFNEEYARKVLPYLKEEYFEGAIEKQYFSLTSAFFQKYNALPKLTELDLEFRNLKVDQDTYDGLVGLSDVFAKEKDTPINQDWLIEKSEKFCKDRALYLGLMESIAISQGENKNLSTTSIPAIMQKALAVSFDSNLGHDYLKDIDKRFEFYKQKVHKIPFHLNILNRITDGGVEKKTLNCVVGETGAGKSIFLCDLAANYILAGEKVLYISLELREEKIAQRIDANLMDIVMNNIKKLSEEQWAEKKEYIKEKVRGHLKIKEYPTSSGHVGHFRFLLQEYKQKHGFVPTIIIIDYINICASLRMKTKTSMYEWVKCISEEIRGLAVEEDVVCWSCLQFNSEGTDNSDPSMKNVGESRGVNHTLDFLLAMVKIEELTNMNQILFKQLKTRYGDVDENKKFILGLDKSKMRFYELQEDLPQNHQPPTNKTPKRETNFKGIKV